MIFRERASFWEVPTIQIGEIISVFIPELLGENSPTP